MKEAQEEEERGAGGREREAEREGGAGSGRNRCRNVYLARCVSSWILGCIVMITRKYFRGGP